jgi:hypothetical protein
MTELDALVSFATQRELDILDAIRKHGSQAKAAEALGRNRRTIERAMERLRARAATRSPAMHDYRKEVPEGYTLKGISQYIDRDGKVSAQWVKSTIDTEKQLKMVEIAAETLCEDIPRQKPIHMQGDVYKNLCNVYTLTDSHVGALAWNVETKSGDWDLDIAERTLTGCFEHMVNSSPQAGTCVVAQLGDFLHYDSAISATTPLHGNVLDADGRMPKMVACAIRILRTVINLALARHHKVIVLMAEGNHDISSSVWLRAMFSALYENEPRLEVINSELPYYVYRHGNTMLAWHHGHLGKNDQLPILFASQFPKMWGDTTKRYIHTGHKHHVHIKEHSGVTVEQHPTLAARDAYAARGGWLAERQVSAITYSDLYGQVARNTVTPEMIA